MAGKTRLRANPEKRVRQSAKAPLRLAADSAVPGLADRMLQLQATAGNRALQRLAQRSAEVEEQGRPDLFNVPGVKLPPPGGGRSLPDDLREHMEGSFGQGFGDVRVHEDGAAKSVGAVAYTQGSDIHFAPGRYQPDSDNGRSLIGHELTHVVQQRSGNVASPQGAGAPVNANPELEAQAARTGELAAQGMPVSVSGHAAGIQRAVQAPVQREGDETETQSGDEPGAELEPTDASAFLDSLTDEETEDAVESITADDLHEQGLFKSELGELEEQGQVDSQGDSDDLTAVQMAVEMPVQRKPKKKKPPTELEAAVATRRQQVPELAEEEPERGPGRGRRMVNAIANAASSVKKGAAAKADKFLTDREMGEAEIAEGVAKTGTLASAVKGGTKAGEAIGEGAGAGFTALGEMIGGDGVSEGTEARLAAVRDTMLGSEPLSVPATEAGAAVEWAGVAGGGLEALANAGELVSGVRQYREEGGIDRKSEGGARIAKATSGIAKGGSRAGSSGALLAGNVGLATGLATAGAVGQVAEGAVETARGSVGAYKANKRRKNLTKLAKSSRDRQQGMESLGEEQAARAQDYEGENAKGRATGASLSAQARVEAGKASEIGESAEYGANVQRKKRNRRLIQAGTGALKLTGGALLLALGVTNPLGWAITGAGAVIAGGLALKRWYKGRKKDEGSDKTRKEVKREEREKYARLWQADQEKYRDVLIAYGFPEDKIGTLEYKTIYKALLNKTWG